MALAYADLRIRERRVSQEPDTLGAYFSWEMDRRRWNPNSLERATGVSRQQITKIQADNRTPEERAELQVEFPKPITIRRLVSALVEGDSDPQAFRRLLLRMMYLAGYIPEVDVPEDRARRISQSEERERERERQLEKFSSFIEELKDRLDALGGEPDQQNRSTPEQ